MKEDKNLGLSPGLRHPTARSIRRHDLLAVVALLALPYLVYFPLAAGVATFAGYDHSGINQPLKQQAFASIREGHLPLWEPRLDRGLPLLAEGEAGVFYPVNWLFLIPIDFLTLYNAVLLLLIGLAGVFFYWWVRRLGAGPMAALLTAVAHQWGMTVSFNKANMNITEGFILAPLLLALLEPSDNHGIFSRNARQWWLRTAGIGGVVACMIFAGQAQYVAYSGLFALIYVALRIIFAGKGRHAEVTLLSGLPFVAGTILGLGLASVQLLPQLELIPLSERGTGALDTRFASFGLWLNPSRLFAAYIFPVYHYSVDQFLPSMSTTAWVGPVPILLAGYAIRTRRFMCKPIIPLLIAGLIFFYLAMGSNAPLAGAITSWGPLGHFRGHGRLAGYFALAILGLMAIGLDSLLRRSESGEEVKKKWISIPPFSIEVALMVLLAIPFIMHYRDYLETKLALGIFAGFIIVFFAGLHFARLMKSKIPIIAAVMIIVGAQVFGFYATSAEGTLLRSYWDADRADLIHIRDNSSPDESAFIAIRAVAANRLHERFIQEGVRELIPGARQHVDYLGSANSGLMENLTVGNADLPLELSRWERLMHRELWPRIDATKGELSVADTSLLWVLGVNWIVTENGDLDIAGFEKQSDPSWKNRDVPFYIYHREADLRPYEVFSSWTSAPEGDDNEVGKAFQRYLQTGTVDALAFVEGGMKPVFAGDNFAVDDGFQYRILSPKSKNPSEYSITITVSDESLFMVRDAWYPGWTVTLNGQPADIVRTDMVYKGVKLQKGRNEVVFRYESTYLKTGLLLTGISALILLAMVVLPRGIKKL